MPLKFIISRFKVACLFCYLLWLIYEFEGYFAVKFVKMLRKVALYMLISGGYSEIYRNKVTNSSFSGLGALNLCHLKVDFLHHILTLSYALCVSQWQRAANTSCKTNCAKLTKEGVNNLKVTWHTDPFPHKSSSYAYRGRMAMPYCWGHLAEAYLP